LQKGSIKLKNMKPRASGYGSLQYKCC